LINLKRVAYGVRDVVTPAPKSVAAAASSKSGSARATIEQVVDQWLGRKPSAAPVSAAAAPAVAPPLSSYKELEPSKPMVETQPPKPVGFVCEEDVRAAIQANSKITVGKKTIITPSARELAEENDVFVVET
jgi:hypothetical protein